jgi:RimJ/RimL family protein N-acetyltransferase
LVSDEPAGAVLARRVRLRHMQPGDVVRFAAWAADVELQRLYLGRHAAGRDPTDWVPGLSGRPAPGRSPTARCGYLLRVIETVDGRLLGWVELRDTNWRRRSGELRICLGDRSTWGMGYGSEALRLFLELAFARWGLDSVQLRVATWNLRAVRAYERCGFRREGRLWAGRHAGEGLEDLWLMRLDAARFAARGAVARGLAAGE